jgi:hypothetical protein
MQRKKPQRKPPRKQESQWIHARLCAERILIVAPRFGLSQIKKTAGRIRAGGLRIRISGDPDRVRLSPY